MFPADDGPERGWHTQADLPGVIDLLRRALGTEPPPASEYLAYSEAAGLFEERDGDPTPYATFLEQVRAAGGALVDHLRRSLDRGHSVQVTAAPPRQP